MKFACPILRKTTKNPLHISITAKGMEDIMNITDAKQSIFDYDPFGK